MVTEQMIEQKNHQDYELEQEMKQLNKDIEANRKRNKRFESVNAACNFYKALGLHECTSKIQEKNGTIAFHDPQVTHSVPSFERHQPDYKEVTKVIYTFHKNGYYRRNYKFPFGNTCYQLNPIKTVDHVWHPGTKYEYVAKVTERILIDSTEEQMFRCLNNILNFRKNNGV